MVVKPSLKCGDRFAKRLKWFGLLVVEKTWLMCRWKVAVSCFSLLASSCYIRPTGGSFWRFHSRDGCQSISYICRSICITIYMYMLSTCITNTTLHVLRFFPFFLLFFFLIIFFSSQCNF
jgi:hypothetical protein